MTTVERIEPADHEAAIRRLLAAADDAFVPPLTAAERLGVSRADGGVGPTSIADYVSACLERPMIGAVEDGRLVGFASIEPVAESEPLTGYTPTNHVTVLVVEESYRNQGLATAFYERLLSLSPRSECHRPFVSTKTWHTNRSHISILDALGFTCVHRIEDDREPGVDTVYYARKT